MRNPRKVRREVVPIGAPMLRIPHTGPLTPRLKPEKPPVDAIGFTHSFFPDPDADEDDDD